MVWRCHLYLLYVMARRFSPAPHDRCEHVLADTASMGAIFEKHP